MRLTLLAAAAASVLVPSSLNAKWYEAKSRHFTVYSEQTPDELKTYSTRLERYDGAIRAVRGTKARSPSSTASPSGPRSTSTASPSSSTNIFTT